MAHKRNFLNKLKRFWQNVPDGQPLDIFRTLLYIYAFARQLCHAKRKVGKMATPVQYGLIAAAMGLVLVTALPSIKDGFVEKFGTPVEPATLIEEVPIGLKWARGINPGTECVLIEKTGGSVFLVFNKTEARRISPAQSGEYCYRFQ